MTCERCEGLRNTHDELMVRALYGIIFRTHTHLQLEQPSQEVGAVAGCTEQGLEWLVVAIQSWRCAFAGEF
jgi:hypothetical protein